MTPKNGARNRGRLISEVKLPQLRGDFDSALYLSMLNLFDNITRVIARRGAMTRHEKILSDRSSEELCLDLARKHAGCVEWTECDTCKRLTRELRSEWVASGLRPFVPWLMLFDHASPAAAFLRSLGAASVIARSEEIKNAEKKVHAQKRDAFLRRCITCERTFDTRFRFERIAILLYGRRPKPLSKDEKKAHTQKRDAFLNCMTDDETQACKDLSAVLGDKNSEPTQRQYAARRLKKLRVNIDARRERLFGELIASSHSGKSFKSRVERLLNNGSVIRFVPRFEKAIRRYDLAKRRNATWTAKLPLLEYLAVEWVRDPKALSRFLDAAFGRWRDLLGNPKSVRGRSIIIHQALGSQSCVERCRGRGIKPMAAIAELLIRNGAAKPEEFEQLYGALRTQNSRELAKVMPSEPNKASDFVTKSKIKISVL
jgi:hypothetical protein